MMKCNFYVLKLNAEHRLDAIKVPSNTQIL